MNKGIWAILAFAAILLIGPITVGPVAFADGVDIEISPTGVQTVQPLPLDDDDDDDLDDDDDDDDDNDDDDDDDEGGCVGGGCVPPNIPTF